MSSRFWSALANFALSPGHAFAIVSVITNHLLLVGDMQSGTTDALRLEGDMNSGTDDLAFEGAF